MDHTFFDLNKLFCTFTKPEDLENIVSTINRRHAILYNKIFILESPQSDELICTYNIDMGNSTDAPLPNTLYTINALNTLIKSLNGGVLDTKYIVNWHEYRNSILLTNGSDLRKLDTSIHKIIDFNK